MRSGRITAIVTGWLLTAGVAGAAPITYTLQGAAFDDGGTVSGFIVYDPSTGTATDWSLTTEPGAGPFHLTQKTYTPTNSSASVAQVPGPFGTAWWQFFTSTEFFHPSNPSLPSMLRLGTDAILTDTGGTFALAANGQDGECFSCSRFRGFVSGSLTAPVPEPGVLVLLAAGLLGEAVRRRGRRSAGPIQ